MTNTPNMSHPTVGRLFRATTSIIALCLFISGCAIYAPVPKGYAGTTAKLSDSVAEDGGRCAAFFFVDAYDGHDVQNALSATERQNNGRGTAMTIQSYSRLVPAREATFHLKGRTHCAAPVVELGNSIYLIEGNVKFTPQRDGQYVVKGELREDHSAVWVEDQLTGQQCGNKLLIRGSTALNRAALLLLGEGVAKSSKQKVEEIPPQ